MGKTFGWIGKNIYTFDFQVGMMIDKNKRNHFKWSKDASIVFKTKSFSECFAGIISQSVTFNKWLLTQKQCGTVQTSFCFYYLQSPK